MFPGMGKIQDSRGGGTMLINNSLFPVGSIHDGGQLRRIFDPPALNFNQS